MNDDFENFDADLRIACIFFAAATVSAATRLAILLWVVL